MAKGQDQQGRYSTRPSSQTRRGSIMDSDHKPVKTFMTITRIMRRAMRKHSKKLPGCKRPNHGSASYFAYVASIRMLKEFGLDLGKLDVRYLSYKQ